MIHGVALKEYCTIVFFVMHTSNLCLRKMYPILFVTCVSVTDFYYYSFHLGQKAETLCKLVFLKEISFVNNNKKTK